HYLEAPRVRNPPYTMRNAVLIHHLHRRRIGRCERLLDSVARVAVEHEYLTKMGSGGPKQVKTISFWLGQGLLVPEHYSSRIILDFAKRNETLAFKLQGIVCARRWSSESLDVPVDRRFRVLAENSFLPPLTERFRSSSVGIVFRAVAGLTLAQNDPDQVIRAGGVVAVLHRRRDFVVWLGSDFS